MIATSQAEYTLYAAVIGLGIGLCVVYPFIAYPLIRSRFRAERRVEFTAADGRVRRGTVDKPPDYGTGLWGTGSVRVRSDEGELLDVAYKKVKPLAEQGAAQGGAVDEEATSSPIREEPIREEPIREEAPEPKPAPEPKRERSAPRLARVRKLISSHPLAFAAVAVAAALAIGVAGTVAVIGGGDNGSESARPASRNQPGQPLPAAYENGARNAAADAGLPPVLIDCLIQKMRERFSPNDIFSLPDSQLNHVARTEIAPACAAEHPDAAARFNRSHP